MPRVKKTRKPCAKLEGSEFSAILSSLEQRIVALEALTNDFQSYIHNSECCCKDYMYEEDVKKEGLLTKLLKFFRR